MTKSSHQGSPSKKIHRNSLKLNEHHSVFLSIAQIESTRIPLHSMQPKQTKQDKITSIMTTIWLNEMIEMFKITMIKSIAGGTFSLCSNNRDITICRSAGKVFFFSSLKLQTSMGRGHRWEGGRSKTKLFLMIFQFQRESSMSKD